LVGEVVAIRVYFLDQPPIRIIAKRRAVLGVALGLAVLVTADEG